MRTLPSLPSLRSLALACGAAVAIDACGGAGNSGDFSGTGGSGVGGGSAVGGFGGSNAGPSGSGGAGGTPQEKNVASTYTAPVATGNYVWIANPTSGRVAYIDASTLQIKLVDAGDAPTYLAAVPDPKDDVAIVLNVLSLDATVLRASKSGITATSLPVPSSGNTWAVSADGHWAIAWTDARQVKDPDPVDGYQDVTVLDLAQGEQGSSDLTVGYRPVAVAFDAAGAHAYAVSQDGVTILSLVPGAPEVVKNVGVGDTPTMPSTTRDVAITPDGSYALVRRDGVSAISVFSLSDGTRTDVPLPGIPTGLALSADGATAVAVVRDTSPSQIAVMPMPAVVADPTKVSLLPTDTTVGSAVLAPASPVGFFFTNATPSDVLVTMDTSVAMPSPIDTLLRAPILGVFPTPDAASAVILHDALDMGGSHYPSAFSLVPVALGLPPKIVGLDAAPVSIAVDPAGAHALVAAGETDTGVYEAFLASMPSLAVQKYPLASLPIAAGIVAGAGRGYVAQSDPDGRITFVKLATGEAQTITGFELAAQVVDGSQ
jgi:hypothetical protein